MGWVKERLIGTIDGSNKNFTLSHDPVDMSIVIVFTGLPAEKVMSNPIGNQYSRSDTDIELGLAPMVGSTPWCRYFWDSLA